MREGIIASMPRLCIFRKVCLLILAIAVLITPGAVARTEKGLDTSVGSFSRENTAMADIAIGIATELSVPLGFEGIPEDPEKRVSVSVANTTLRGLFDTLIRLDPRYEWTVAEDGVINIYPRDRKERMLDITVPEFRVQGKTRRAAMDQLIGTPAVLDMLSSLNVVIRTPIAGLPSATDSGPRVNLDLRNATIRRILNEILVGSGASAWSAVRYGDRLQYLSLSIGG